VNMRNFVLRSSICAHALAYVSVLPASNHAWAQAFDISAYYTNQSPAVSSNKEPTKSVSVRDYLRFALGPVLGGGGALYFYGTVAQPCKVEPTLLVLPVRAGTEIIEKNSWRYDGPEGCGPEFFIGPPPVRWIFSEK
jgi:hypothetical protein